jgi:hypothetical protein
LFFGEFEVHVYGFSERVAMRPMQRNFRLREQNKEVKSTMPGRGC